MSETLTRPPKRIFIIGPMTQGAQDSDGIALAAHIPNIATATRQVLERLERKLGARMPGWQVNTPENSPNDIPREVFSHMMHTDFAIADISTQSPNVFYELAILHAIGVRVIILGEPAFYLNQFNCIAPRDFSVEALHDALAGGSFTRDGQPGQLEHLFAAPRQKSYYNPITRHFGGVDLVNVAAATGIATGNFYNFTKWVLKEGGVFRQHAELEDIVLIRPERILDVDRIIGMLQREFGVAKLRPDGTPVLDRAGHPVRDIPQMTVHHEAHPRGEYTVRRVGNHLLDYPTPISSLSVSRQFLAMGEYVRDFSLSAADADLVPFERRLIDIYFQTLEDLARNTPFGCDWGRVRIMPVEEAIAYLRGGSAQ